MPYIVSPFVFVVVIYFSLWVEFVSTSKIEAGLGASVFLSSYASMLIMYIVLVMVGTPVFWLLKRFDKIKINILIAAVCFIVSIVLVPMVIKIISDKANYFDYLFNLFVGMGLIIGIIGYALVFYYLTIRRQQK